MDVLGRYEPETGELHYPNVLSTIDTEGYESHVGPEFRPESSPEEVLTSIRKVDGRNCVSSHRTLV